MTSKNKTLSVRKPSGYRRPTYKHVVYVDGYNMRQMLPDLDIIFWRGQPGMGGTEFIPPGEIWIDHRYINETDFLLRVFRIETMARFARTSSYDPIRAYMKKKLCKPGPVPPFVERKTYDKDHCLEIWYVRGEIIRNYLDPAFIFGGHDLRYDYIPKRTVWVDIRQDPREIKYLLAHELRERTWMEKSGLKYDAAHERAIKKELLERARNFIMSPIKNSVLLLAKKIPLLPVVPTDQEEDASCGPGSLGMALNALGFTYRGKPISEKRLRELSECGEEGTEHAKLISAAKACGDNVFYKENGTLEELRHFVLKERLPVLVGWWNGPECTNEEVYHNHELDEGHFSVIVHITERYIWLADPWIIDPKDENKGASGIRKVPIWQFMEQSNNTRPKFSWCDTDTNHYLPVNRWYMVCNSKGKMFRIPGGANK